MRVWRLARSKYAKPDGEGARRYGGRWNFRNTAVIYTSSTLSLSVLEILVHTDTDVAVSEFVSISADIPESVVIDTIDPHLLPQDWRLMEAHPELQTLGTTWVQRGTTAVLQVPSAIIPTEQNLLINPSHPDFSRIIWERPIPFTLDSRLLK